MYKCGVRVWCGASVVWCERGVSVVWCERQESCDGERGMVHTYVHIIHMLRSIGFEVFHVEM